MKQILLTKGQVACVDEADFDRVSQFSWHAWRKSPAYSWYACRTTPRVNGVPGVQGLHSFLFPGVTRIDHKDGNGLNNTRANLRQASRSENGANCRKQMNTSSAFKGVTWHKSAGKWLAQIKKDQHNKYLGLFDSEEAAAKAYDRAASYLFGEFAKRNFAA